MARTGHGWRTIGWGRGWWLVAVGLLSGCNWMGYAADVVAGGAESQSVEAAYPGLADQSVVVLTTAGDYTLFEYPQAVGDITRQVSRCLPIHVSGVQVMGTRQIERFVEQTPHWQALSPGQVVEQWQVDRLVWIELVQYATHEPGDRNLWRGVIVANVRVAEAQSSDHHDPWAYATTVQASFPQRRSLGRVGSDDARVRAGVLHLFAQRVCQLFYDHQIDTQGR